MEQRARVARETTIQEIGQEQRPRAEALGASQPAQSVRASAALAALRTAEERTGARPARLSEIGVQRAERPPFAVPHQLAGLLPDGLRRGSVLEVTGSAALMLEILASASEQEDEGLWIGMVGHPLIGVLAAAEAGVDLTQLILVPRPGPDAALALAALLDGVDILVIGPETALLPSDRRRLMARARERGVVLLATTPWEGAHVILAVTGVRWRGLGAGSGRLLSRELTVTRAGRTSAAQRARVEVTLPTGAIPAAPEALAEQPTLEPVPTGSPQTPLRLVG